jgi:hypothetical protein
MVQGEGFDRHGCHARFPKPLRGPRRGACVPLGARQPRADLRELAQVVHCVSPDDDGAGEALRHGLGLRRHAANDGSAGGGGGGTKGVADGTATAAAPASTGAPVGALQAASRHAVSTRSGANGETRGRIGTTRGYIDSSPLTRWGSRRARWACFRVGHWLQAARVVEVVARERRAPVAKYARETTLSQVGLHHVFQQTRGPPRLAWAHDASVP